MLGRGQTKETTPMKTRHLFAALAATCLAIFQGCDSSQSLASVPGDRSSEGKGNIAFRLSQPDVNTLNANSYYLEYKVWGPGIDSFSAIYGGGYPDTAPVFIHNIPCGTRIIEVTAMGFDGIATWYGADTIEVNAGKLSFAHILLGRLTNPYGTVVLDISLDSNRRTDTVGGRDPIDTVWSTLTKHSWYPYTYDYCEAPTWRGTGDSLRVNCFHVNYKPIPGDTIWKDTIVHHPVPDSGFWCRLVAIDSTNSGDSTVLRGTWSCLRTHYVPYDGMRDTSWFDSLVNYPVDSTPYCYPSPYGDSGSIFCTRLLYRTSYDPFLCDSIYQSPNSRHYCTMGFDPNIPPVDTTRWTPVDSASLKKGRGRKKS
jgi:hypothetical protein